MVTNIILAFKQQLVAAIHKYRYRHQRVLAESLRVGSRLKCTLEFKWCSKQRCGWDGAGGIWHCTSATFHDVVFALGANVTTQRFMPRDSAHL